ncbi:MAG: DUF2179 domain-containing protein [Eubacteriaceae bacterium]|nr:DUF2179 domain-containing protein [Eubacteriaceae bacterium]
MADLLSGSSILVYCIIFIGKIIEITLDTIRIVLINRGEKLKGAILGFIVIVLWIFIVSSIITNLSQNYFKAFLYALAYAIGNYVGVTIEEKLAIGLSSLQIIVPMDMGEVLAHYLREEGYGLTVLDGHGFNNDKKVLILHIPRKKLNEALKKVKLNAPDAVIIVSDVKRLHGGYLKK